LLAVKLVTDIPLRLRYDRAFSEIKVLEDHGDYKTIYWLVLAEVLHERHKVYSTYMGFLVDGMQWGQLSPYFYYCVKSLPRYSAKRMLQITRESVG